MRRLFLAFSLLCFSAPILWADATVFVYHRFNDTKHASTSISNKKLRADFQYLKDNGYTVIKLSELANMLKEKRPIPPKTVALTIDDDYKSFYTNGLPIFKEFGYPFTLYVYVKATKKGYGDYMSWEEIKKSSQYGEIGLHSYDHPHLTYLDDKSIRHDTRNATKIFEEKLGPDNSSWFYIMAIVDL